jgi:hypothetical protein
MQVFNVVSMESLPAPFRTQKEAQFLDFGVSLDEAGFFRITTSFST